MPDGNVNLPRIKPLFLNGLTVDRANKLITNEYKKDGQTKRSMQVNTVTTWRDGVELSSDELESDVPF